MKSKQVQEFKETEIGKIPADWKVKEVKEISKVIDSLHKTPKYANDGYPMVRVTDIETGPLNLKNTLKVTKEVYEEFTKNHKPRRNDVVVSRVGTYGITSYVDTDEQFCLGQNTAVIHSEFNNNFVYYALNSKLVKNQIEARVVGSTQKTFSLQNIRELQIPIPANSTEISKITKILSDLDSKISSLQNQNKILEQTAQAIFKSWFADFDGQTEFENSELGQIPKGWSITDLKSVLSLRKDGSHNPPKRVEAGIPFIAGASDVKHFVIDFSNCSFITQIDYEAIHKNWEIKTNDILLTIVGTIGNVAIVTHNDLPFSLQRSLAVLRPNEKIDFTFLYFLLTSIQFEQFLYANLNPTGQPGIYLGTLGGFKFILPPKPLIEKFFDVSEKIISIIQKNQYQIKSLTKTRDALLPKLMSGEIRV